MALAPFLRPRPGWSVERHHRRGGAAIGRPGRQVRAVRVAVSDEVDPVARRQLRQLPVGVVDEPRKGIKIVEHIEDFAGVKGAGLAAQALAKPALRCQRRTVEPEAEDVRAAVLLLRLDPGPARVSHGEVAAERLRGSCIRLGRSARIQPQRRFRLLAKDRPDELSIGALRVVSLKQRKVEAFILVPPSHERHIALLAGGEDLGWRAWQEPAIDDRTEAEAGRRGEDRFGGKRPQLGQGLRSCLAHEVEAGRLGFGQRGRRADRRCEHRPALADDAPEQPLGEGRGHERARGFRAGQFAGESDLSGIAPEGGDVALPPSKRRDAV